MEFLHDQLSDLEYDFTLAMEELVYSQEAVAHTSRQLTQVILERDRFVNTGSIYDNVDARQKKRKLTQFQKLLMLLFGLANLLAFHQLSLQCRHPRVTRQLPSL